MEELQAQIVALQSALKTEQAKVMNGDEKEKGCPAIPERKVYKQASPPLQVEEKDLSFNLAIQVAPLSVRALPHLLVI